MAMQNKKDLKGTDTLKMIVIVLFHVSCHQVLRLPIDILGLSEVKAHAVRFLRARWDAILRHAEHGHIFSSNSCFVNGGGFCHRHGKECKVATSAVDIACGGLPCKAFSAMREKRGPTPSTGPQSAHPSYAPVAEFVSYLKARKPGTFWIEEVEAFANIDSKLRNSTTGILESHLEVWSREVVRLGYSIRVMRWQHQVWVSNKRSRLLIFGVAEQHGGKAAGRVDAIHRTVSCFSAFHAEAC